jgi:hypothetical protein
MPKRPKERQPAVGVHVRCSFFAFKFPPKDWWDEAGVVSCEKCHQPIEFVFGWRSSTPNIDKHDFNWLIPTHAKCACLTVRLKEIPKRKRQQRNNPQQALFDFQQVTDNPDRDLDL